MRGRYRRNARSEDGTSPDRCEVKLPKTEHRTTRAGSDMDSMSRASRQTAPLSRPFGGYPLDMAQIGHPLRFAHICKGLPGQLSEHVPGFVMSERFRSA